MLLHTQDAESSQQLYQHLVGAITPRPIAWVSTRSATGVDNIAPYSFFSVASCQPPVLSVTHVTPRTGEPKDTLKNLLATKECVVNIVTEDLLRAMNQSCANYPSDISEFTAVGIDKHTSHSVSVPGVAAAPVRYECTLREVIELGSEPGSGQVMLLDVKTIDIDDALLVDGRIAPERLPTIGKLGGDAYAHTTRQSVLSRPVLD